MEAMDNEGAGRLYNEMMMALKCNEMAVATELASQLRGYLDSGGEWSHAVRRQLARAECATIIKGIIPACFSLN